MSNDGKKAWAKGDLAMCVKPFSKALICPQVGGIYEVNGITVCMGETYLHLEGMFAGWLGGFFCRIEPLSPEQHEAIIVELADDARRDRSQK